MSGLLDRLLGTWKRNGNGARPETKEYPATGVTFIGGAGAFTNAAIHWLNKTNPNAEELDRATAFATAAYCYTAMMWRMGRVSEPPLMVVRETEEGEEWQPNHPLAEIFDSPRPDLDMGEIIGRTVGYRDLTGAALWVLDRDVGGRRRQITPFSGAEFKTEAADGLIYGRYLIKDARGQWKPVPREDVVHFREVNPFSWRGCTSRVDVALMQLNLSHTVHRITQQYLLKAMFPGGIVSPDKDWHPSPEEWELWKATIEAWYGGPANSGTPLALQGGTTFSRTASGMADLLPAAVLDRVEATVGSVFGAPPVVLGWLTGLQNSPWSQMSEARRQATEDTVQPIWRDFENRVGRVMLTPAERKSGLLVRFDTSQVRALATDEERTARIAAMNSNSWMVDELRLYTGQSKLPDDDPRGSIIPGLPSPEPSLDLGNGEEAEPAGPKTEATDAAEAGQVAGTALNGAQVAALIEIVQNVKAGTLPITAADAIIRAAFPLLSDAQIADIFEDVEEGSTAPEEAPAKAGAPILGNKSADTRDLLWLLFDLHTKAKEPGWERAIAAHLEALRKTIVAGMRAHIRPASKGAPLSDTERKAFAEECKEAVPQWVTRLIAADRPKLVAKVYPLLVSTGGTGVRRLASRLKLSFSVLQPGLLKYARRESALLADVMGKTTGQAVARAVQAGLNDGDTIDGLVKRLEELPAFDRTRAKLVARSETTRAWNGAQRTSMSEYRKESGNDVFKSWLSARDSRVRDEHADLDDGSEIPIDSAFSNGLTEPGEPNCLLPGTLVEGAFVAGLRAEYAGEVVVIRTAGGRELTVTPNHPILTPGGFAPADLVCEGQQLLSYLGEDAVAGSPESNKYHTPASVEEVFGTLAKQLPALYRKPAAHHLHGDAVAVEGEIEVVGPGSNLLVNNDPFASQERGDLVLAAPSMMLALSVGGGASDFALQRIDRTPAGLPSVSALALDGAGLPLENPPLRPLCVGSAAKLHTTLSESQSDRCPSLPGSVGKAFQGRALTVGGEQGSDFKTVAAAVPAPARLATERNPGSAQRAIEPRRTEVEFAQDLRAAFPGHIALDRVTQISRRFYRGHVYDLQSVGGWNVAGGILVSNCRCSLTYRVATPDDEPDIDVDEPSEETE